MTIFQAVENWMLDARSNRPVRSIGAEIHLVKPNPTLAQVSYVILAWSAWKGYQQGTS